MPEVVRYLNNLEYLQLVLGFEPIEGQLLDQ